MVKVNTKPKNKYLDLKARVSVINDSKVLKQRAFADKYRVSLGAINSATKAGDLGTIPEHAEWGRCFIKDRETENSVVNQLTLEFSTCVVPRAYLYLSR